MSLSITQIYKFIAISFLKPEKQNRFIELASSRILVNSQKPNRKEIKKRAKYQNMMSNLEHWFSNKTLFETVEHRINYKDIINILNKANSCNSAYVMSSNLFLDGKTLAISEIFKYLEENAVYGTLIFIESKKIAYYEHYECQGLSRILYSKENNS